MTSSFETSQYKFEFPIRKKPSQSNLPFTHSKYFLAWRVVFEMQVGVCGNRECIPNHSTKPNVTFRLFFWTKHKITTLAYKFVRLFQLTQSHYHQQPCTFTSFAKNKDKWNEKPAVATFSQASQTVTQRKHIILLFFNIANYFCLGWH